MIPTGKAETGPGAPNLFGAGENSFDAELCANVRRWTGGPSCPSGEMGPGGEPDCKARRGPGKMAEKARKGRKRAGPPGGAGRPARYRKTKAVYPGGERRDR